MVMLRSSIASDNINIGPADHRHMVFAVFFQQNITLLRYQFARMKLRLIPCFIVEDGGEFVHRMPDIAERGVKRGEAKPQNIRRAEIPYHAFCNQRCNNGITAIRMGEGDLRAARSMVSWGD